MRTHISCDGCRHLKTAVGQARSEFLRAAKIAEALEAFTLVVDFEQDEAGRIAS